MFGFKQPSSRRRFHSHIRDKARKTREEYYSLFTVLAVKIILFIFLCTLLVSSIRVMQRSFKNISDIWRAVLPGAVVVIAAIIGWTIYNNIKEIIRLDREVRQKHP
jgi:uncharacterized integral membrane protein